MATKLSTRAFLRQVAESKRGFKFGEPERIQEDGLAAVVPILRKTSLKRQYVTFPETGEQVLVRDTGSISAFSATNNAKDNVFVRAGTIFKGATQERCLVRSAVLFPGRESILEVRCVHHSKGIRAGTQTSYGGISPFELDQQSYTPGFKPADQMKYWQGVENYSASVGGGSKSAGAPMQRHLSASHMQWAGQRFLRSASGFIHPDSVGEDNEPSVAYSTSSSSSISSASSRSSVSSEREERTSGGINLPPQTKSDDLHSTVQEFSTNIDDILRRVERKPNQVGIGIITDKGCQTIELFDVSDSWAALHGDAVKRVGQDLSRKNSAFEFKPAFAISTMAAVLADDYQENVILEHRPSNGEPPVRIIGLTSERFLGEICEIDGRAMHLLLNRR